MFSNTTFASQKTIAQCHEHIKPLHEKREIVAELDGIWGLFEKNRVLQGNSVIAINLDRKINSVLFHLEYLCDTLNGIPMNEVARFVRDGIEKKGEGGFRKELIDLGKPETEVDIWFEFARFSLQNKERSLELNSIFESIEKAKPYINSYVSIATAINNGVVDASITENTKRLAQEIDHFFETNKYMNQALTENANVPYVDINESSGGS